jgi:hypothetical protein
MVSFHKVRGALPSSPLVFLAAVPVAEPFQFVERTSSLRTLISLFEEVVK